MKDNGNVIELRQGKRKKSLKQAAGKQSVKSASVTDITELRKEIINDERRRVKRTILTEFIGANVIVPGQGLVKVALYDISEGGLAFDLEEHMGQFKPGEKIAMRVYMNPSTYFPFIIEITHAVYIPEEQVSRMGARFVKDSINKVALYHFVKFIETVSANLRSDDGDVMVSNIR